MDNIVNIRNILERTTQRGEEQWLGFLDLKAAFGTIQKNAIQNCPKQIELYDKLIQVKKGIYENNKVKVQLTNLRNLM